MTPNMTNAASASSMKLRAFIGSSSETLAIANAIAARLSEVLECTVWKDDFFKLSHTTIETLSSELGQFDLGIFVFGKDDELTSRVVDFVAARDNVIFESGLFCGRIGPKHTIVVRSSSKELKWLADLEGFTAASYDEALAVNDPNVAVEEACNKILQDFGATAPKPGVFVHGQWKRIEDDWWTYGGSEVSSVAVDDGGIEIATAHSIGLRYPRYDNLNATGRYCSVRLSRTSTHGGPVYFAVRAGHENIFLSLSDSHQNEGWGTPENEFMLRLPNLKANQPYCFVIDLEDLASFIGRPIAINGFRLRPGFKVSHFSVSDDIPSWLKDAVTLKAATAPAITIEDPTPGSLIRQEYVVRGTVGNLQKAVISSDDIEVFVLAPDNVWHPQRRPALADGKWQVRVKLGDQSDPPNSEFRIACITTNGKPTGEAVKSLPSALGKSVVRVTREAWKVQPRRAARNK